MKKILFIIGIFLFGLYQSQTYYSQNFNTPGLNGWVSTDIDGDTYQWSNMNVSSINPDFGTGSLVSFSYISVINAGVTPDNLVTSPLINLGTVSASNVFLKYDLATHIDYPEEKYSVYVTTSNNSGVITASSPVFTETVAAGGFQKRSIDLTSFIGQQVYVSFRHYDCNDQFYLVVDNVEVKTIADKDIALKKVSLDRYGVTNSNYTIKATVTNNGTETINNITVNWNDGTADHISTIALAVPLASGEETIVNHPVSVNYSSVVDKNIDVTVTQVNGAADATPADNSLTTTFNTVSQNSTKKVLIEEGTGTWCGWCPRGTVAMNYMDINFPDNFIGIAVHNNDPMEVAAYNTGAAFSGFPGMNVDRVFLGESVSTTDMTSYVNERKNIVVPAQLDGSASLSGDQLTFNASATFRTNFTNANFRFAVVLIEDGVKGTIAGYKQTNYYANNAYGPMGGFEGLPNPVPAAQMEYNHVGRMLLGGYTGQAGSIPTTLTDGQNVIYTFNATIPPTYNMGKIKAVVLLLDAGTGEVVNARSFILSSLGTNDAETNANYLTIYPNPAADYIKVQANHNVDLRFYDASGKLVLEKSNVIPDSPVSVQALSKGVYMVSIIEKKSKSKTQKLIIK
ncbi:choice-of-anchor J domain-containing protein [Chryseobacterium sp. MEBOG06]|uniref:T9SS-dependent choice-of-anchor J family protein n=1 Tax=Chryseobacterium sp. MEBOG06 TaxID=2879938 RepID=UPI001F29301B|nr:choice-of-anchor J domain-containing protein [Chryseobacterium sp. MEBOG06]UKB85656.1 choice-of-anchor J domain-containing protein [Chryseobacterium sp. MEBOG06]